MKHAKVYISVCAVLLGLMGFAAPAGAVSLSNAANVPCAENTTNMAGKAAAKTHCHARHCLSAMDLLAEISGKSAKEIAGSYPQKTAWQAAKEMGKLDELKKAYLSRARVLKDKLVEEKCITAQDGDKMYADIEKRVTAIDGVKIVITGKPGFVPQFQSHKH